MGGFCSCFCFYRKARFGICLIVFRLFARVIILLFCSRVSVRRCRNLFVLMVISSCRWLIRIVVVYITSVNVSYELG